MKKFIALCLVLVCVAALCVGCSQSSSGKRHIEIEVAGYGTIYAELDPEAAPITVENFCNLVEDGFYDGLTFHRISTDFVIQGGDPTGTGSGGSANTIKGEFAANGWDNPISHKRGVISMARKSMPLDSASSQFFIMLKDTPEIDGYYAAFGCVTEGMDIVDAICADTPSDPVTGLVDPACQPVITSIRLVD